MIVPQQATRAFHVEHSSVQVARSREEVPWWGRALGWPLLALLWLYRRLVSPALPPACRYFPSCSQYAVEAIVLIWKRDRIALGWDDVGDVILAGDSHHVLEHLTLEIEDLQRPGRWVEYFACDTWADFLRRYDRFTAADRLLQEKRHALHIAEGPPRISRFIARHPPG